MKVCNTIMYNVILNLKIQIYILFNETINFLNVFKTFVIIYHINFKNFYKKVIINDNNNNTNKLRQQQKIQQILNF